MGLFSKPKVPKVPKPPTPPSSPLVAKDSEDSALDIPFGLGSFISTSSAGLRRKANTQRTSLIGG
jgi:hypothetical protein